MKSTYIIGEIGQNHNGSVDIAKLIVDLVSRPVREEVFNLELRPMDAVKMTNRKKIPEAVRRNLYYLPINISFIEDSATDFLQKLEEDVRGN